MMLTLMLTSKGVAAVPRASLVILSGALTQFGLPLQGVAVILGVDALMDMARTSINLVGNCLATVVMARWEGVFELSAEDTPVADALRGQPLSVPAVVTPPDEALTEVGSGVRVRDSDPMRDETATAAGTAAVRLSAIVSPRSAAHSAPRRAPGFTSPARTCAPGTALLSRCSSRLRSVVPFVSMPPVNATGVAARSSPNS